MCVLLRARLAVGFLIHVGKKVIPKKFKKWSHVFFHCIYIGKSSDPSLGPKSDSHLGLGLHRIFWRPWGTWRNKPPSGDVCLLRFLTPETGVTADATFGARGAIFLGERLKLGWGTPGSPGG